MNSLTLESPSVQSYLSILQSVINRMAANSAGCKTWCIALVSVTVVIIADKDKPDYVWISIVPIVLFLFLDSYYLGLERIFRVLYNDFIRKLHSSSATINDVFIVTGGPSVGKTLMSTVKACTSISIWPFYSLLALMLAIVRIWIL